MVQELLLELVQPFTMTCCDLPVRKFFIYDRVSPEIPQYESLGQR